MADAKILVASDSAMAQIRVIGRTTFTCSPSLRDFGLKMIADAVSKIVIDLSECEGMDSTFMGVLAMIGRRGHEKEIAVEIVNVGGAQKKLLDALGLRNLFTFSRTAADQVNWVSLCNTEAVDPPAKTMLEAHETLMEVDADNIPKFKDVVEFLKEDIRKLES
jgi:anti-anti-sigma factor